MHRIYFKFFKFEKKGLFFACLFIAFTFLFLGSFLYSPVTNTYLHADEASDLQLKIDERNANIKQLEQEIAQYKTLVDKTSSQAKTLAQNITLLQTQQKKLATEINLTQKKISATNQDIGILAKNIDETKKDIENHRSSISATISIINEQDASSKLASIVGSDFQNKRLDEIFQTTFLTVAVRDGLESLATLKTNLQDKQTDTIAKKDNLVNLQNDLKDQKILIAENQKEKDKLLKETKNQEAAFQAIVIDKDKKKEAFEKELFDYEAKLKYVLNPGSLPQAGVLSWPLDEIYVTQQFGVTNASARLYVSGSHNGTDFKAPLGTPVKSAGYGKVIGTGDTDATCPRASFGSWVLITYDNGLSTIYGHLSVVKASVGQSVKTGDIVGYSGNTGYSTGPHLHVSMYAPGGVEVKTVPSRSCAGKVLTMPIAAINAYVDPMKYFPPLK